MEQEKFDRINRQVMTRITGLETRMEALEHKRQRGIWIERIMNWLIIIGLVIAVIMFAMGK